MHQDSHIIGHFRKRLINSTPAFKAKITHGERSLDDCKGKWLVAMMAPPAKRPQ
ncbi:1-Cys peroxiredoxin [Sphingobium sp. MI1205]|nr:1-Cys peroxiredoxin [Sphingobium sp. MI1205]